MLDIKFIRENADLVKQALQDKCLSLDIDALLDLDKQIIRIKQSMEAELQQRNALSKEMPKATPERREEIKELSKKSGQAAAELAKELKPLEEKFQEMMGLTPTIPAPDVPRGKDEEENVVIRQVGEKPTFDFPLRDHVELMDINDWGEFKKIPQICGSRTVAIKGELLQLEMALWQFTLAHLMNKGFTVMSVPSLSFEDAFFNTGHFPFDYESVYTMPKDNLYLAGTAEVILNSIHSGEILKEADLPITYAGFSPCFRREAGAAGKDTRGLIRVHQFSKVEQYVICKADVVESDKMHAFILNNSEEVMQELEIPYQIIANCTGDMGAGKYRMNDIEAWCPGQNKYRETHSCSSLLDWQARRTNIRYREEATGKVKYAYTLNNTGLATPRVMAPFLENHQQADGTIRIPKALQPFMGGKTVIGKGIKK